MRSQNSYRSTATTIGKAAKLAGVGVETIRFYERRGLIAQPLKPASGGFRDYPPDTLAQIRFIREAQELGFSLAEAAQLLTLRADPKADCAQVQRRAEAKLDEFGIVVKTPSGYLQQSPYLSIANKAMEQMTRLLVEFGMSPASRSRVSASWVPPVVSAPAVAIRKAGKDPRELFEWDAKGVTLKDSSELSEDAVRAVAEVSETAGVSGVKTVRIKLHDKKGALDSLARHLGLFAPERLDLRVGFSWPALFERAMELAAEGAAKALPEGKR